MNTKDFYYDLPQELIAQTPIKKRDDSRLMVLDRTSGKIFHEKFFNIIDEISQGDCLVINNSKVLPARIYGYKKNTGAKIELLLLRCIEKDIWQVLAKPGKRLKVGTIINFDEDILECKVLECFEDGTKNIRFSYKGDFYSIINSIGEMPLPPYIKKTLEDRDRYQTIYSKKLGSSAAPTAGLHFTEELLRKIKNKKIKIAEVTLHVGLGTFQPVKVDNIEEHKMHSEYYEISDKSAEIINSTKKAGKKIFSVGTTSCRVLESIASQKGKICESKGFTDIFIYPGYDFKVVDALITNFHLPESTLIMLVSAFAGYRNTMNAYKEAVKEKYRFFSFGDAMLIK